MRSTDTSEWSDHLEAVRYTTQVFTNVSGNITSDLVLADLLEEQKSFVTEQIKQSIAIEGLIPDRATGSRIRKKMVAESVLIAVLNRNHSTNTLLKIIGNLNREHPPEELMMEPGMPAALPQQNTLGGKIKNTASKLNPFG